MKQSASYFFAGLLTGLLLASIGGALLLRPDESGRATTQRIVLKMGHGLDESHPVHKGMIFMRDRLEELTGGAMTLDVYAGGVLGGEIECLEQVQKGEMDMTKVSIAAIEAFIPQMKVFSVPFTFRDADHFWNVLHSPVGREILDLGISRNFIGLCYYDSGDRNFYSRRRPIRSVADIRGMKVRVMNSRTAMDMINAMGGSPTPINWGELYTALAQGTVDAAENNPPSFITSRHYEICKFFSFSRHQRIPDMVIVGTRTWERLSDEQRTALRKAAEESETFQRDLWTKTTEECLALMREQGVEIIEPEIDGFRAACARILEDKDYEDVRDLYARIQEVK